MQTAVLIFPHQLFGTHPALHPEAGIFLVEEWLFFRQYKFHKQKLVLHRASMQAYRHLLENQKHQIHYIDAQHPLSDVRKLLAYLAGEGYRQIRLAALADDWLFRRIQKSADLYGLSIILHETPAFLTTPEEGGAFFKKKKDYFQTPFYIEQRKKHRILLDAKGNPLGGKWSFDQENRLKFPKGQQSPPLIFQPDDDFIREARQYVEEFFPDNPGSSRPPHFFAWTASASIEWLHQFLEHRFYGFGDYEDAIVADEPVLHHAVLSPMLNIGLLTPPQVLESVNQFTQENKIPLNAQEGFIRQLIGWREFIRLVYEREGRMQRTRNYWHFSRRIPASFYEGTTGIVPVDDVIRKILKTGYCHHIERLMILGNFMLLCEFDPGEVYKWFMELFIDAYDWVMVPNVYGMSQFADGGLITTKPYFSGSNYLLKMSHYKKAAATGDSWQGIWDALFWRFIDKHRTFFSRQPRMGMLVITFDKMPGPKKQALLQRAGNYLNSL